MAGGFFSRFFQGRDRSETQAVVPAPQQSDTASQDVSFEFNTFIGASYMNVVSYGATQNSPYTIQEITRMARNPMQYIKPLRKWAKWAYYSNGTVTTAIDSLISLHSLDYVVVVKPKKAGGSRK